jgi:molybdate transport system substrate-binding protein
VRRCTPIAALAVLLLAGCASSGPVARSAAPSSSASPDGGAVSGPLTVFAAASLTGAFTAIGKDFQAAHPGTAVTFNFAGSSALAQQINQGAPADVFASAAPTNMADVTSAISPVTFARNQLVIAVPKGNPKGITKLADLAEPGLKLALCAGQVPCGAAANTALKAAGVTVHPVTEEQDVKAALAKVTLGEVDAALVYRTDALAAASSVDGVEFPESAQAVNTYPIAVLRDAPNPPTAREFVTYVLSPAGQRVLAAAGFQSP